MLLVGVAFCLVGLGFIGLALLLFGRFRAINKRLYYRYGAKPNLLDKWRGDFRSNEAWRSLVIQISAALAFGLFGLFPGIVTIYTASSPPGSPGPATSIEWNSTGQF